MILHLNIKEPDFRDYGVLIPIAPDKVGKILDHLKSHEVLGEHYRQIVVNYSRNLIRKKDLLRVHSAEYVRKLFSKDLTGELLKTYELYDEHGRPNRYDPSIAKYPLKKFFATILKRVTGTYLCSRLALNTGFCFFLGGGMHHGKRDYGEGFCVVNDVVIAIRKLQAEKKVGTVWIIDVDVHKGDGTAALTEGDDTIITLSVHMARGWPLDKKEFDKNGKPDPSFIPSKIDIPIGKNENDKYNQKLEKGLKKLKSEFPKPDLAVVLSGSDPYKLDELKSSEGIKLSLKELFTRDKMIYNFLDELKIPAAYIMAGGYGKNSWKVYTQFFDWVIPKRLGLQ